MAEFGEQLRKARESKGITQQFLAEKGKTIEIDGKKVTVWQSHLIQKSEQ